jgi:hypothetical protein
MNRNEFNRFIAGGALPGPGDLEGLRELTVLFPWFHSAHLVLLRGLKENADVRFDSQLKASALSVSDREVLYHYLFMSPVADVTREEVAQEEVSHEESVQEVAVQEEVSHEEAVQEVAVQEEVSHEESVQEVASIEEERHEEVVQEELPPIPTEEAVTAPVVGESPLRTREELMAEIEARLEELASVPEGVLELDVEPVPAPEAIVEEEKKEQELAAEDLMEFIKDSEPAQEATATQLSAQDLIDRFIKSSPTLERMTLPESQPVRDLSETSTEEEGSFITETLAKIYINQGYYSRAINIYEKLSLQYPEKSAYFAGRIEKINDLIK